MKFDMENLDSGDRGVTIIQDSEHVYVQNYPANTRLIVWAGLTGTDRTWATLTRKEALVVAGALQAMANRLDDAEE